MNQALKFERMTPENRRAGIIEAAMAVLLESGGADLSIRAISRRAGISVGLINHHFGNRDELLTQIYEKLSLRQRDAFEQRISQQPAAGRDWVDLFIECYFSPDMLDPRTLPVWMVFWQAFPRLPRLAALHRQIFGGYCGMLERALAACGVAPERLRMTALGLIAMLDGLWLEYTLNPGSFSRDEAIAAARHWIGLHMETTE